MTSEKNVASWMLSQRLYEEFLFFYFIIIGFLGVLGFFILGFEVAAFSDKENLLLNFICLCLLCGLMALTPFWYRLIWGSKGRLITRTQSVEKTLAAIADEKERKRVKKKWANNGKLPPTKWQLWAIIFLGWWALFEIFIISAEFRNYEIVWYPEWMQNMVQWAIEHTRSFKDKKEGFFPFRGALNSFDFLKISPFNKMNFNTFEELINSSLGHCIMFFTLWRHLIIIPLIIAVSLVFWKMFDWLGYDRIDPKNTHGIVDFVGRVVFSSLTLIFVFNPLMLTTLPVIPDKYMLSKYQWADNFYSFIICLLFILFIKTICGWLLLLKRFFMMFINLIIGV